MLMRGRSLFNARTFSIASSSFSTKVTGKVKFFNVKKGYGFIVNDADSADVFVHQTNIFKDGYRSLAVGEAVEYEIQEQQGKLSAMNVTGPGGKQVQGAPASPRFEEGGSSGFRDRGEGGFKPRREGGERREGGYEKREFKRREN